MLPKNSVRDLETNVHNRRDERNTSDDDIKQKTPMPQETTKPIQRSKWSSCVADALWMDQINILRKSNYHEKYRPSYKVLQFKGKRIRVTQFNHSSLSFLSPCTLKYRNLISYNYNFFIFVLLLTTFSSRQITKDRFSPPPPELFNNDNKSATSI